MLWTRYTCFSDVLLTYVIHHQELNPQGTYVNRTRKALRPYEHRDLDFLLDLNHIGPDFMQDGMCVDGHVGHVILYYFNTKETN